MLDGDGAEFAVCVEAYYQAVGERARAESAETRWGDDSRLLSDDVRGRSYAHKGQIPVLRVIRVDFTPVDTDLYGCTVAQVECDGTDVSFELVRRGLPWCFRRYVRDDACRGIEAEAKAARRGLWRDPEPAAQWGYRAARRALQQFPAGK